MGSMRMVIMKITVMMSIWVVLLPELGKCDVEEDRAKCGETLLAIATCLPYVSGEARAPTMDCCTGFGQVLQKSPECVCLLIKDRDDQSLGLHINATLAIGLPQRCRTTTKLTVSDCPAILHLPPNSPDAQIFQQLANNGVAPSPAPSVTGRTPVTVPATQAHTLSGGGNGKMTIWGDKALIVSAAVVAVAAGILT